MAQSKNLLFRIPAATPSVRESNEFQAIKAGMVSIDAKLYEALTTLNGNALTEVNALIAQSQASLRDGVSSDGDTLAKLRTLLTLQNQISNSLDLTSVKLATGNQAGGYPVLDSGGKVASAQLPSFVDDVLEHVSLAAFPGTGEVGKIYVALDTNKTYRWSGSVYVYITSGAVDSVAGKTGIVTVTQSDVGLGNVNNTSDLNKPISIDQQIAIMMAESNAKAASTPVGHIGTGNDSHALVNSGVAGFMSAADKIKLDAISGSNTGDETTVTIRSKLGISTLSGVNTGDQTTITGNAGTATKLETARLINGVSFDGTSGITINAVDSTPRVATSLLAVANGVATLDGAGKVPSNQLPAYIDDVLEFINLAAFPATGEAGKIYVALDTNKTYRWGGSSYIYITSGAVDSVAGKNGVVTLNKTDVGLDNVDNTADSVKYVHHSSIAARTELVTCNPSQVSPGPAAFTDLTGLDAYQSTDFPGSYYSGFTSMEGSGHRGIQFVGSWNCETGQVPFAYIRGKDETQGNWGTWTEFVLNNGRQYSIHISGNADTATALQTARLINGIPFNGTTDIALTKSSIGLGNVDNTADANKPVSTAQSTAINAAQANAIAASTPVTHIGTGSTAHAAVTTSSNGFMSAADKIKLDAISGSNTGDETTATIKSKLGITTLSGSNTGDQTTVTGNAGTATALQTARTINGVSFNGTASIKNSEWFHSTRDFPLGTAIYTDINYAITAGEPFILEIVGHSYGSGKPIDIKYQGYIYADTIINHGGISNGVSISGLVALNVGGALTFWFPTMGYWCAYNVRVYRSHDGQNTNAVTSIENAVKPAGTKEVALTANIWQSFHTGNIVLSGDNTGDQTNITGNAGTAGTATYLSASQQVNTITGKQASMAMAVSDVTPGSFTCRATGAGDANLAGMTFYNDAYAVKLGVRADGYFGLGGWSRAAWSWYSAPDGSMVAAGNVTAYSDPRLKENITPITGAIDILKQINGVRFDWKQGFAHTQCKSGKRDIGILANEVEAVLPELITESIELEGERYKTVAYSNLIPVVIEAFKEMHADVYAELDKVKKQLSELQATIAAMKSSLP